MPSTPLPLTPEALEQTLATKFPANASCWSQATDEIRDMCRAARMLARVPDDQAVCFGALTTPAQWNSQGVAGTVRFYRVLGQEQRSGFCAAFAGFLGLRGHDGAAAANSAADH